MSENENKAYSNDSGTGSVLEEMDTTNKNLQNIGVELLPVHAGGTVHAKRIPGTFRTVKWLVASVYLIFFLAPYIQWDGHQAIQFLLAERQFHIFHITILPQDIWMLAAILLFFALLLAATTAVAGRLWCGYACFQTIWMDVFTWIEEKIEGAPNKRMKLEKAPMSFSKLRLKLIKWSVWLAISMLTAFTFVSYFSDAVDMWVRLVTFDWTSNETIFVLSLGAATFFFAGFLREQTCIGFCPYARIQGAMIDTETVLPTYDQDRGEPRGRLKRAKAGDDTPDELGDCIDCNLCVAVCPTGVDIRKGQQFGCITCGLCIDACDSVMEKLKKPKGLIRYASLAEFAGKKLPPLFKRPRVIVYSAIMSIAAIALVYGLATMSPIDVKVLHERAPLFVQMSTGEIQNKYTVKVVNKNKAPMNVRITVEGHENLVYVASEKMHIEPGNVGASILLVRLPKKDFIDTSIPVYIHVQDIHNPEIQGRYESTLIGPRVR